VAVARFALLALAACKVLPPPPVIAPHAGVEMDREGTTSALVVFGYAGELLGGGGIGVALRVEHQTTEHTVLGVELTGGYGDKVVDAKEQPFHPILLALRTYGRSAIVAAERDFLTTYGVGLGVLTTGALIGSVHAGVAIGYPNDLLEPIAALGVAIATPLLRGEPYGVPLFHSTTPAPRHGDMPGFNFDTSGGTSVATPSTELFIGLDLGVVAGIGSSNRLSFDLGAAVAADAGELLVEGSVADGQR
jgi:hypothetical protein